jgi:hypothetical protein
MDNSETIGVNHLSISDTGIPGGELIDNIASNLASSIRDKAKGKEAQKIADAGNYWTLRPYLKSLIPIPQYIINQVSGQGVSYYAVLQLPEQSTGASNDSIIRGLKALTGNGIAPGVTGQAAEPAAQSIIGGEQSAATGTPLTLPTLTANTKKYLIIGLVIAVIVIGYFLLKHKK